METLVEQAHILVAIVTYSSESVIAECLGSLADAFADDLSYEVVVVDNASTDATTAIVRDLFPAATIVASAKNLGFAAGVNSGIDAASRPYDAVLVLNPDVRLEPKSVKPLYETLAAPGVGVAVPRLLDADGHLHHSLRREPSVSRAFGEALLGGDRAGKLSAFGEAITDPKQYEQLRDVAWATGAAMLISRDCYDAVGPLDESFFLYSEETDFMLRAGERGYRTRYTPRSTATHLGGESNTTPELWSMLTRNRVSLFARRHGKVRSAAFKSAVVLNEAVRAPRRPTNAAALRALLRPTQEEAVDAPKPPVDGYVCFSAQDWWYFNRGHSDFQLMLRIARKRPVLFVNSLGMRMPLPGRSSQPTRRIARKLMSVARRLRHPVPELPNFQVFTPFFLPVYGSSGRLLERVNAALVRWQVTSAARKLGIHEPAVVVTLPTALDVVEGMHHRVLVYNHSDKHSAFTEANRDHVSRCERELTELADVVVSSSRALLDEDLDFARRAAFLDHGVDVEHFTRDVASPEPPELSRIARPRIGFFGGIDEYVVDVELLELVAREIPEAELVLVGDASCPMDRFEMLPNAHWLGQRPYEAIPRYGSTFDVALMPWVANEWIAYANPIKLKEYLALGLPVVSTRFPEGEWYGDVIEIVDGREAFVAAVRAALTDGGRATPQERRARVEGSTWDAQAALLMSLCEDEELVCAES